MAIQTTYNDTPAKGFAGMVVNGETDNRISRIVEGAVMPFGAAAFRGTGRKGCDLTPAAGEFLGIAIADHSVVTPVGGNADEYAVGATAALLNEGVIYVVAGEAVTAGAPAYVTAGGAIVATATGNTAIPAVFDEAAGNGEIVALRVTRS